MSHFSKQAIESDPESAARLREVLHSRSTKARTGTTAPKTPTLAERFGVRPGGQDNPERQCHLVPAGVTPR